MHHSTRTILSALLALAASTTTLATPLSYNSTTTLSSRNDANTFNLHVWNNCHFTKEVALYSVTADFKMLQRNPRRTSPRATPSPSLHRSTTLVCVSPGTRSGAPTASGALRRSSSSGIVLPPGRTGRRMISRSWRGVTRTSGWAHILFPMGMEVRRVAVSLVFLGSVPAIRGGSIRRRMMLVPLRRIPSATRAVAILRSCTVRRLAAHRRA